MSLLSSVASDALAYFTWLHAAALLIALIGGMLTFDIEYPITYDGDKVMPNWEWRRGTGHGVYIRSATLEEVYAYNNKGRSYRKAWERIFVVIRLFGGVLSWFCALVLPTMALDPSVTGIAGYAWSAGWKVFNFGVSNHLSEVVNWPVFMPALLVTLLATVMGFRIEYGMYRLLKLRRRQKGGKLTDSLTRAEKACMGLSWTDCFASLAGILALIYPIVRALQCVFAPGASGMDALPVDYHSGMLLYWQAGASAVYLLWAVVQSFLRAVISRRNAR